MATDNVFDDQIVEGGSSPLREERYVMKLVRLEATEHPEFGRGVKWVFNVADGASKSVYRNSDGSLYEYFQTTPPKINVPREGALGAKQFRMASALLGRDVVAGESANAIAAQIIGKYFEPLLALNKNGNLGVASAASLGTYFKNWIAGPTNGAAPAAPAPEPEPVAAAVVDDEPEF